MATIDVAMTVPWDMLVAGSGELVNPQEVLTKTELDRLAEARRSDKTVMIRTAAEVNDPASRPRQDGTLTWRFHMADTRDVAFSASRAFIWDAARMNLPGGKPALAQSVYPVEGAVPQGWGRSTEYLKHAVENFSRRWSVYPWPVASSLGGPINGMEYPGVAFDSYKDKGPELFWITAHEIGHTWFPMVVGFNERRDQWMDEGFNTFIDIYESDDFKEFGPKRDGEYAPKKGNPVDEILPLLADREAPIMMTRSDQVREKYRHPLSYFKSALGLVLLREQILGPERFDWAFRKFIADWSFKHPAPSDFFRAMNSAGGRGSLLVLAGLVFQQLEPGSGRDRRGPRQGRLGQGRGGDHRQSGPDGDAIDSGNRLRGRGEAAHRPARRNLDPEDRGRASAGQHQARPVGHGGSRPCRAGSRPVQQCAEAGRLTGITRPALRGRDGCRG